MKGNTVECSDLVGDLVGFPLEIVQKMVNYQIEQTGKVNISIFQEDAESSITSGGFFWGRTKEGTAFWRELIQNKDFLLFSNYKKRIKKQLPPIVVEVFADNGEHSHWQLVDSTGKLLWEGLFEV